MEYIIIDLVLTVFVYLLFPIMYVIYNGKTTKKNASKLALINSIVCAIIFMLIRIAINPDASNNVNFAPAVLYYFIAKAIMTNKEENNKNEEN